VESPALGIEAFVNLIRMELSMSKTDTVSPLRQRMIEDMAARKLNPQTPAVHRALNSGFSATAWRRSQRTCACRDGF
jgi:hypothetical protein